MRNVENHVRWILPLLLLLFLYPATRGLAGRLDRAYELDAQVLRLYQLGKYNEALPLGKEALEIWEKELGSDHPAVATALNNLAVIQKSLGRFPEAIELHQRALAIREKALGPDHFQVAESLSNLAETYNSAGEYEKALPLHTRALEIRKNTLGEDHPDVGASLNNLAETHRKIGNYIEAEKLYKQALKIKETNLGPNDPAVATSLNNLAVLYNRLGQYELAEALFKRALAIDEVAYGAEHPIVADDLNNLAGLYRAQGEFSMVEPLLRRALAIDEKTYGFEHPDVAVDLNNLALIYKSMGDWAEAEPLYLKALDIREKILGKDHPDVAQSLVNLASLYYSLGDFGKAEPLYKRALAIDSKAFGDLHPDVALKLSNLAELYRKVGAWEQAESYYKKALAIDEGKYGPFHPDVAKDIHNLAMLYFSQGKWEKAEPLFERAVAIREKALGDRHPALADSLTNLADVYFAKKQYDQAEKLLKKALVIKELSLGESHPETANCLKSLAGIYVAKGNYREAGDLYIRALEINAGFINHVMGFTSENQKMKFLETQKGDVDFLLSLVAVHLQHDEKFKRKALEVLLRRKGIILEAQRKYQQVLAEAGGPEAVGVFERLSRVRRQISQEFLSASNWQSPIYQSRNLSELSKKRDELEARLSRLSHPYARHKDSDKITCEKVAGKLPQGSVLIELARVHIYDFSSTNKDSRWHPENYLAFILHSGSNGKVELINLGEASQVDQSIADFKKQVIDVDNLDGDKILEDSRKLYRLIFTPIEQHIAKSFNLFISPGGNLNLIPFEVLLAPSGRFLIEDYTINYLAAGRDLLNFGVDAGSGGAPILLGDPAFNKSDTKSGKSDSSRESFSSLDPLTQRSGDRHLIRFSPLPGTRAEIKAIQQILGPESVQVFLGEQAREEVLLKARSPRIMHLATHGFFLSDQDIKEIAGLRTKSENGGVENVYQKFIEVENPLLRSGLALAGANQTIESGALAQSDGLLTAEKVLNLRLRGTDLVVLSACETGLGEVKMEEGVYGLRRAFLQAGARSLVMSMWSVPDRETRELMVNFYQNITHGLSRVQSLRQAALKQLDIVKERYGHSNPLFWGAFVFLGEP